MKKLVFLALSIGSVVLAQFCLARGAGKLYRDPAYKFSIHWFSDWEQLPPEAGQKVVVAKFHDPADKGRIVATEIEVYRVSTSKGGETPVTGGDKPLDKDQLKELAQDYFGPKDAFTAMTQFLRVPKGQKLPDKDKDAKPVDSADGIHGKMYSFEVNLAGEEKITYGTVKDYTYFAVMAVFAKDNIEYGIKAMCPTRDRKKYEADYKSVMKTFKVFDDQAKDVQSLDVLKDVKISAARRQEIERQMIKGWGVMISPKKNYVVIYNTQRGKNKELATTISDRIEKIRERVYESKFPPAQPIDAVSVIRICKDEAEYHGYGGPGGSAGYWNSGTEELVFYDMSKSKKVDENTLSVLYHEAFHQYIYYSVGNVAPHSWFNEGHGDYFAGSKYTNGKFDIGPFKWRIGTVKNAIREGARQKTVTKDAKGNEVVSWTNKGYTPLKDLVAFSQGDYYSYPGVSYAQGWSIIYFLRERVPKNPAWNAKWGKILDVYFNTLKDDVNKTGKLQRGGLVDPKKPGPDDPGKGGGDDPGKGGGDDPGKGGDGDGDGPDEPEKDPGLPPEQDGFSTPSALQHALDAAFKGIDWDEFEKAWKDEILKISG